MEYTKMDDEKEKGMSLIVKTITRLTVGLILLYGLYIVMHGHITPGGGFAGGVIVGLSFVHMVLGFGKETALRRLSESAASSLESLGGIAFVAMALLGIAGGAFFLNVLPNGHTFKLLSAGIIPPCNVAICLKVSAGLFSIFMALVLIRPDSGRRP